MPRRPRDPFEVPLKTEDRPRIGVWLLDELQRALDARSTAETDVDYWWQLYEQARTRTTEPWPDAADLTSYLAAEKVDALHARLMRTIWSDPVWTVEGWGEAAQRAPFVEEFTQWKAEESRLQGTLDKLALISLVEPRGLLEVYEGHERRLVRTRKSVRLATTPEGGFLFGEDGGVEFARTPDDQLIEAQAGEPAAETVVDQLEIVRTGPQERIIPYRDSVILPGHARDKAEIWGYGKRFWRLLADLQHEARDGRYDRDAIARLTPQSDRVPEPALTRSGHGIAAADSAATADQELWELLLLLDLPSVLSDLGVTVPRGLTRGARWYLVTLHPTSQQLLRLAYDDVDRRRFVPVILFPRPDRATEGFSLVGHKLLTLVEEHTAWRNMAADRGALVVQAPMKRLVGALWDPMLVPWGPHAVIDVRDMNEVQPVQVPDYTAAAFGHIEAVERQAERVVGVNDIAAGQVSSESRTLGEITMATQQSFIRMDLIVHRFHEAMEDLAQIRHAMQKRALAEQPEGVAVPASMLAQLEGQGVNVNEAMPNGHLTAALLEGTFRFKPAGSVETADPARQRVDFVQALQALPGLVQTFPALMPMLQTPQAARAMFRQFLRVFRVPQTQAFLGSPAQDVAQADPFQSLLGAFQLGAPQAPAGPMGAGALAVGPGGGLPGGMPPAPSPLLAPSTNTLQ